MGSSHGRDRNIRHSHSDQQADSHQARQHLGSRTAMDPPGGSERVPARRVSFQSENAARFSHVAAGSGSVGTGGARNEMRRGHSDGEVLRPIAGRNSTDSTIAASLAERRDSLHLAIPETAHSESPYGRILNDLHTLHTQHDADRRKRVRLGNTHDRRSSTNSYIEGQGSSSRVQQRPHRSTSDSTVVAPGSSMPDVIDLTSPERPLPARPSPGAGATRDRRSREIVLPRWQPDIEVSKCPICGTSFGFWFRKHHCRKCGRVVCANCSPHRITIPRQFIVRPPVSAPNMHPLASGIQVVDLTDDNATPNTMISRRGSRATEGFVDPALGGGEEVRICNPCVPDPNFDPPPQRAPEPVHRTPLSSPSFGGSSSSPEDQHSPIATTRRELEPHRTNSHSSRQSLGSVSSAYAPGHSRAQRSQDSRYEEAVIRELRNRGDRSASTSTYDGNSENLIPPPRFNVFVPDPQDRRRHGIHAPSIQSHRREYSNPNAAAAVMSSRYPNPSTSAPTSNYIPIATGTSRHHRQNASTSSSGRPAVRSMLDIDTPPSRPRPRLREEDICPICHSPLPLKGPDGSETAREQHVIDCISSHYTTNSPSHNARTNQPSLNPATATAAAIAANSATPAQAGNNSQQQQQQRPPPPRINHMLRYQATEKDCIGDEGEAQECVICFEEFIPGVEMARLECLCKFHKVCIRQWWDTKGDGSCPVHIELRG